MANYNSNYTGAEFDEAVAKSKNTPSAADISSTVNRALKVPVTAPTSSELVGIGDGNEQERIRIGEGLELEGETSPKTLNVVGVADARSGDEIKLWVGSQAQYDAITTKSNTTIYYIVEV